MEKYKYIYSFTTTTTDTNYIIYQSSIPKNIKYQERIKNLNLIKKKKSSTYSLLTLLLPTILYSIEQEGFTLKEKNIR